MKAPSYSTAAGVFGIAFSLAFPVSMHAADDSNIAAPKIPVAAAPEMWRDPAQPLDARVHDLVSRMSLEEKVSQLSCDPVAIPRLGIPSYSHRNECLHGVANGVATVFPQAIGMAATWATPLIQAAAD